MFGNGLKILIITLFLFIGNQSIYSQNCVYQLKVIDKKTLEPLEFVNISYKRSEVANWELVNTDNLGLLKMVQNYGTEITYSFGYLGYAGIKLTLKCAENNVTEVTVEMEQLSTQLKEVTITEKFPEIPEIDTNPFVGFG